MTEPSHYNKTSARSDTCVSPYFCYLSQSFPFEQGFRVLKRHYTNDPACFGNERYTECRVRVMQSCLQQRMSVWVRLEGCLLHFAFAANARIALA